MAKRKKSIHDVLLKALGPHGHKNDISNDRDGNTVHSWFSHDSSRYPFDRVLSRRDGWQQYDTDQDAWYYGVWVNPKTRQQVTYAEGDLYYVWYPSKKAFRKGMKRLDAFHG